MRIEFTIDPTALFYAVMDKTLLDKSGIEAQNVQVGDTCSIER